MVINVKKQGSIEIVVIFAIVFLATASSFIFSQLNARADIEDERKYYTQYYNLSALSEIAIDDVLNDLCGKSVTIPITPLNSNIFGYEEAFKYLTIPAQVSVEKLAFDTPELQAAFSFAQNATVAINSTQLKADFSHAGNILNFQSGDVLHLDALEITSKIQEIKIKHTIAGLTLNAVHIGNSVVLQLDDTYMEVVD